MAIEALGRVVCIKTWDDFKKLAVTLRPRSVMYFLQRAPLSKPPLALRFLFTSENTLYIFLDCADGEVFKQTKILIKGKGGKQRYVLHEDIKEFIVKELERRDLDVISPIFSPARYLTSLLIQKVRGKASEKANFGNAAE